MDGAVVGVVLVVAAVLLVLRGGMRVVNQVERGVVFRWGKALPGYRQPGVTFLIPFADRMRKMNVQVVTMPVPTQEGITKDNVSVKVDAVVYFRVTDPVRAAIEVQDYVFAVGQVAQSSLRSIIGKSDLDDLLTDRERLHEGLAGPDDRQPGRGLGRPHRPCRDQGRTAAGVAEAVHVPAGRGGAGAAGPGHHGGR